MKKKNPKLYKFISDLYSEEKEPKDKDFGKLILLCDCGCENTLTIEDFGNGQITIDIKEPDEKFSHGVIVYRDIPKLISFFNRWK